MDFHSLSAAAFLQFKTVCPNLKQYEHLCSYRQDLSLQIPLLYLRHGSGTLTDLPFQSPPVVMGLISFVVVVVKMYPIFEEHSPSLLLYYSPTPTWMPFHMIPKLSVIGICLTSLTRAKPKEKNEICHSISTRAVKCDGVFFVLQHGFQYGFQHA